MLKQKEWIDVIVEKTGCTKKEAKVMYDCVFDYMREQISPEELIKISGFGVLKIRKTAPKEQINLITGKPEIVPEHNVVTFRPYFEIDPKPEAIDMEDEDLEDAIARAEAAAAAARAEREAKEKAEREAREKAEQEAREKAEQEKVEQEDREKQEPEELAEADVREKTESKPESKHVGNEYNFDKYYISGRENTEYTYVLNTSTMKIHHPDCSSVPTIKPENFAETNKSIQELELEGYSTCGKEKWP